MDRLLSDRGFVFRGQVIQNCVFVGGLLGVECCREPFGLARADQPDDPDSFLAHPMPPFSSFLPAGPSLPALASSSSAFLARSVWDLPTSEEVCFLRPLRGGSAVLGAGGLPSLEPDSATVADGTLSDGNTGSMMPGPRSGGSAVLSLPRM